MSEHLYHHDPGVHEQLRALEEYAEAERERANAAEAALAAERERADAAEYDAQRYRAMARALRDAEAKLAAAGALADGWEREGDALAPPDDWGASVEVTIRADFLREKANELRAELGGEATPEPVSTCSCVGGPHGGYTCEACR